MQPTAYAVQRTVRHYVAPQIVISAPPAGAGAGAPTASDIFGSVASQISRIRTRPPSDLPDRVAFSGESCLPALPPHAAG